VVTVHDLIQILFPQVMSGGIAAFYARWLMGQAVRRARIVIADSENTRGDLVRQFGVPLNKVRVIWLGVERRFRPVSRRSVRGFLGRWGIKAPYLLYVGQCRPHKNLARLVRAFALYRDAHPGPLKLVLRTVRDPRYAELHREIEVRGLRDSVLFLEDPIASADLPLLYGGAEAFVFPSLYEGFGLPPLEAMACGIPVVASRAASLPEVVGDAALLVDPRKERDMAEAIHQAVADRRVRAGLIARGMRRARLFDWDETVRRTLKVYEEAVRL
jgi:glycosyltransferase involved in cell wall biosynthesis